MRSKAWWLFAIFVLGVRLATAQSAPSNPSMPSGWQWIEWFQQKQDVAASAATIYQVPPMKKLFWLLALVGCLFAATAGAQFPDNTNYVVSSGGSANAQTLAVPNYVGPIVLGLMTLANTGPMTLNVNGTGVIVVKKRTTGGLVALTGGEITAGQISEFLYDGTQYELLQSSSGSTQGVFNARTMYGAIPDGSTDNSTAIAAAFTAANAFAAGVSGYPTTGSPTVYFDCDTGTTTCQYKYGGSGTSPINMASPMTLLCAPGATLNYTGSAHAVEIGPSSGGSQGIFQVRQCTFTGGANYTEGLYLQNNTYQSIIENNIFANFGNLVGATIFMSAANGNWDPRIISNNWIWTDGGTTNVLDAHNSENSNIHFVNNVINCFDTCPVTPGTYGYGLWINPENSVILSNKILGVAPAIIVGTPFSAGALYVIANQFEANPNTTVPAIQYGNPNTTGKNIGGLTLRDNIFYWPVSVNTIPYIGPSTASSGSFALGSSTFENNLFGGFTPSAQYINTNGGGGSPNVLGRNFGPTVASGPIPLAGTPKLTDSLSTTQNIAATGAVSGQVVAGGTDPSRLFPASFDQISNSFFCGASGTGTAQTCSTNPFFTSLAAAVAPVHGSVLLMNTNTPNTGAFTLNVNSTGVKNVTKFGTSATALVTGDIVASTPYLLIYDGTQWELQNPSSGVGLTCSGTPSSSFATINGNVIHC